VVYFYFHFIFDFTSVSASLARDAHCRLTAESRCVDSLLPILMLIESDSSIYRFQRSIGKYGSKSTTLPPVTEITCLSSLRTCLQHQTSGAPVRMALCMPCDATGNHFTFARVRTGAFLDAAHRRLSRRRQCIWIDASSASRFLGQGVQGWMEMEIRCSVAMALSSVF
jgi:hypothetical protein